MASSEVDDFVDRLTSAWQKNQCREILRLTREATAPLQESIKWNNPFFERNGAVVKWFCAKDWINVYFYKGAKVEDPEGCFEATDNTMMRTIKLFEDRPLNAPAFASLLESAIRQNSK